MQDTEGIIVVGSWLVPRALILGDCFNRGCR